MILGIDFGATTTDFVVLKNAKIFKVLSAGRIEVTNTKKLLKNLKKLKVDFNKIKKIAVTGGKSKKLHNKKIKGIKIKHVDEIKAIGLGGSFLSGKKSCVVVSCGTGTCVVNVKNNNAKHFGGTAVGGGTLKGLSKLLLGTSDLRKVEKIAAKGNRKRVDLTVRDVIGSGIGIIPARATASNFAKLKKFKKSDVALALINMVGEVVAVTTVFAAKALQQKTVVFTGRTIMSKKLHTTVVKTAAFYAYKPIIPKMHEFSTATGAAVALLKHTRQLTI